MAARWTKRPVAGQTAGHMTRRFVGPYLPAFFVFAAALGACVPAMPEVAGPRPPHHTDDGFVNPPGSPERVMDPRIFGAFMARRIAAAPVTDIPPGHVVPEDEAIAAMARIHGEIGDGVAVTWLGHATFLVRIGGKNILTDPYLTDWATPLQGFGPKRYVAPGVAIERLPKIDAVIVSHNHYDHLDARTVLRLPGKDGIRAVVPLGVGEIFQKRGYSDVREVDWGDAVDVGNGVRITGLPVIHWSQRTAFDMNRTLWASYKIEGGGKRLYFPGDTAYGPVFADVIRGHGPFDLAFVPIGSYEPQIMMRAVHTDPEQAVQLGQDVGAKVMVGMHWGTVNLTEEPPFEPPARFRAAANAAGIAERDAWIMKIGETRVLADR